MISSANSIQLIFAFTASFGIILVWPSTRFRPLSLALLMEAALMLCNFAEETGISQQLWGDTIITPVFGLGFGPALFLFTRGLVFSNRGLAAGHMIHFVPMLAAFAVSANPQLIIAAGTVSLAIYLSLCWHLIHRYERASQDRRSDADNLTLGWLKLVLILYISAIAVDAIRQNLQTQLPITLLQPWYVITLLVYLGLCCFLIYQGVHQPELFDGFEQYQQESLEALDPPLDETASSLFAQIDQQLLAQKLYRTPRLSLADLSQHTGLSEKDISWAINQGGGQSFADYINRLRIDEVCKEIRQGNPSSLLDIALAAGFNSKSSFNTVFKRLTGQTPSQFQKDL